MLKKQFVIVKNECENLVKELNDSLTTREELEKSLSEANDVIKRNDCGADHISQMTQTFRNRSGLGFLDASSSKPIPNKSTSKPIIFVKAESNSQTHPTPKKHKDAPKNISLIKKTFVCHHCGVSGHIRPFCYKLKNSSVKGSNLSKDQFNMKRPNPSTQMSHLKMD